jgi:Transposase IS116/IS110/IS902 family
LDAVCAVVGKLGVSRCGGIENTSLISLTSEESRGSAKIADGFFFRGRTPWFGGWPGLSASALKRPILPVNEVLSRPMCDRRAVARYAGLTGAPDESGTKRREQGLAKASNARVRRGMIQFAWRFLRFQQNSALARWYQARTADRRGATRNTMIVALARKLLIALWRFVPICADSGRSRGPDRGAGLTKPCRPLLSCPSWTPRTQIVRCPRNRGNFIRRPTLSCGRSMNALSPEYPRRRPPARPRVPSADRLHVSPAPSTTASPLGLVVRKAPNAN